MQYVGIEIISTFVLAGGIAVLGVGLSDTIKERSYQTQSNVQATGTNTEA
jgi:hypothetical protein